METKQKQKNVISYNVLSTANGHLGVIGANVQKLVDLGLNQEQEEKLKMPCMEVKTAKEPIQKLKNVISNNVLLTANGQNGTIGALAPKAVELELGKEPEKFQKKLYLVVQSAKLDYHMNIQLTNQIKVMKLKNVIQENVHLLLQPQQHQ